MPAGGKPYGKTPMMPPKPMGKGGKKKPKGKS
jgi:hypothetical protein